MELGWGLIHSNESISHNDTKLVIIRVITGWLQGVPLQGLTQSTCSKHKTLINYNF